MPLIFTFLLLLLPLVAYAQDMDALTNMEGRYTVGPWVGAQLGDTCQLSNDEPLAGASLVISGQQGSQDLHATIGGENVTLDYTAMTKQPFLTVNDHIYDLTGFVGALDLLKHCLNKNMNHLYPDMPLQESDAVEVDGAPWQITTLMMKDFDVPYTYAKLATLSDARPLSIGVWLYARDHFFLTVTGTHVKDSEAVLGLDGGVEIKLPVWPQEDGALIPLSAAHLKQFESSRHLQILGQSYDMTGFKAVVAALQSSK